MYDSYGYGQPMMQQMQMRQNDWQQRMQTRNAPRYEVIQVNGENGARAFAMAPNSSALLMDATAPIVWLCTTDGAEEHLRHHHRDPRRGRGDPEHDAAERDPAAARPHPARRAARRDVRRGALSDGDHVHQRRKSVLRLRLLRPERVTDNEAQLAGETGGPTPARFFERRQL